MIVINPGTGPVAGATLDHAYENMRALLQDCGHPDAKFRRDPDHDVDGGRWPFLVTCPPDGEDHHDAWEVTVDMPGIPLEKVRYTGEGDQNIWHFPRLYVDGNSWVWKFAISQLGERLAPENESVAEEKDRA